MNNFTNVVRDKVLKAVNVYNMFDGVGNIVVGFSGGADSVCLLHLLNSLKCEFGYSLKAVHVNHGIRGAEAKADELFAQNFCEAYNIPFCCVSVDCIKEAKESKESLEECGRRLRYGVFEKYCTDNSRIATAHNANDNVETVIFNITRGTSVKGLSGIPFVRGRIIRPLLYCSRKEIEGYCAENSLSFVTDSTNLTNDYTRNKIRHLVLPVLEEINPAFTESFSSLSDNAQAVSTYITHSAEELSKKASKGKLIYDRTILLKSDKSVVMQMFHSDFERYCHVSLGSRKINSLYSLLEKSGRLQICGDFYAEAKKNCFRFYSVTQKTCGCNVEIESFPFEAEIGDFLLKIEKLCDYSKIVNQMYSDNVIDCNKLSGKLVLRTRKAGDSFTFSKRNITKSLKKLFNEENIAVELRNSIPVLSDDIGVVWVYGFGTTKRCKASGGSDNIILVRGKNNDR